MIIFFYFDTAKLIFFFYTSGAVKKINYLDVSEEKLFCSKYKRKIEIVNRSMRITITITAITQNTKKKKLYRKNPKIDFSCPYRNSIRILIEKVPKIRIFLCQLFAKSEEERKGTLGLLS